MVAIKFKKPSIAGSKNPNWKGGLIEKTCEQCDKKYMVKPVRVKSKFCSLQCVGKSQKGSKKNVVLKNTKLNCQNCRKDFEVPSSHAHRYKCCSKDCSFQIRAKKTKGDKNPNWNGGLSRMPYAHDFNEISRQIRERDNHTCQNPDCWGKDKRMTAHHIDYDKNNNHESNLITLCSSCNSRANFGRAEWQEFYIAVMKQTKKNGGGWDIQEF